MVVNKKSRQQMNEDLHLFLEDSTEPFVNWLHDQVLKKLQKVTVKKKTNKEIGSSIIVKEEKERKKIKIEDQTNTILGTEVITKLDRDREFEELVGDLTLLNENDNKSELKDLVIEEKLQKKKYPVHASDFGNITINLENQDNVSSILVSKPLNNEKKGVPFKYSQIDMSEKINEISTQNLKHTLNVKEILHEKNTLPIKHLKTFHNIDNKYDNNLKSYINKPKITSVISVKTRLGVIPSMKKSESKTITNNDIRSKLNKNHLDIRRNETINQRNNFNQSKSVERRKQRNEDLKIEQNKNDKIHISNNLKIKSNKIGDIKNKGRLSNKSGTVKSRLGINVTHKQDGSSLKSCNSIKISKPKISNVKSRLGVRRRQQISGLSDTVFKLSQMTQYNKSFDEEDNNSEIKSSLKSHIIEVKKHQIEKQSNSIIIGKKEEENDKFEDKDPYKISSKIIVTPRPLKPLQPSLKRATQSLLLRAVAEANQSVVMQKKMDPCLKVCKNKKYKYNSYIIYYI
jgi:hypothetical protein